MAQKLLSQKFYDRMAALEKNYPTRLALLIPALHAAQDEQGWLSPGVMDEIGVHLGIHPARVRETASFYSLFNLKPVGRHQIRVCTNVACCLRGGEELLSHCERNLGIRVGETTRDGRVTLFEEECLGACGTAPAAMVDGEYHENLDPLKIDRILEQLK